MRTVAIAVAVMGAVGCYSPTRVSFSFENNPPFSEYAAVVPGVVSGDEPIGSSGRYASSAAADSFSFGVDSDSITFDCRGRKDGDISSSSLSSSQDRVYKCESWTGTFSCSDPFDFTIDAKCESNADIHVNGAWKFY